ncbi:MAG: hypothetical protein M0C28_36990 [Candidatus Moduliflexus flocculans]|nr:hypothetical protein [Candidatus Moduliflexus flocculans]
MSPERLTSPGEDRLRRAQRRRRLSRARPRLGRARPRGDLAGARVPGRGVRRGRARERRPGRHDRRRPPRRQAGRLARPRRLVLARRRAGRPRRARASTPSPRASRAEASPASASSRRCTSNGRRLRWGADARVQAGPASLWGEFLQIARGAPRPGPHPRGPARGSRRRLVGERHLAADRREEGPHDPARAARSSAGRAPIELAARYEETALRRRGERGLRVGGQPGRERPPRRPPGPSRAA